MLLCTYPTQFLCPSLTIYWHEVEMKSQLQRLTLSLYFSLIAATVSHLIICASPPVLIICFTSISLLSASPPLTVKLCSNGFF